MRECCIFSNSPSFFASGEPCRSDYGVSIILGQRFGTRDIYGTFTDMDLDLEDDVIEGIISRREIIDAMKTEPKLGEGGFKGWYTSTLDKFKLMESRTIGSTPC